MTVEAMAFACGTLPAWPMMTMKRPPPCRRMCGADAAGQLPRRRPPWCGNAAAARRSRPRRGGRRDACRHCSPRYRCGRTPRRRRRPARRRRRGLQMSATKPLRVCRIRVRQPRRRALRLLAAADRDRCSLPAASRLRDGEADPAGAAGDQRRLAGQVRDPCRVLTRRRSGDSRRRC